MERKKQAESSVLQEQEQLEQEQQARHHRQNPIAALIRRGAEEAGRQQGNSRAVTKVQRMINSLQWRQAHSKDEFYPLALESGIVLRFRQLQAGEVTGLGTGATVWPAAHVLAKYLERRFGERGMCGSRLVDLGSGTGVAGIVAAALGAEAYLTDQEQLLFLMRENAEMCARRREEEAVAGDEPAVMHPPSGAIHVLTYDWGMKDDDLSPPVDIILVSDCVLPKLYPIEPLVDAIDRLSGPDTVTIMSYEHRHYQAFDPRRKFEELAAARGLVKTEISQAQQHPIFSADDIEIWEVRRRRCDDPTSKDQSNTGGVAIRRAEEEAESSLAATLGVVICTSPPQCSLPADEEESPGTMKVVVEMLGERHELAQSPSGAIGCYLWPSAVVMARHIVAASVGGSTGSCSDGGGIAAPPYPARATVLELGSGVGLVAMAAALLGWKVVGTDKADAMPLLESNVTRCLSSTKRTCVGAVEVVEYDWGADAKELLAGRRRASNAPGYDVVICADCVYARASVEPLLESLRQVCDENTILLVTNELRSAFDEFLRRARGYFEVEDLVVLEDDMVVDAASNQRPKPVALKRLRRRVQCSPLCDAPSR